MNLIQQAKAKLKAAPPPPRKPAHLTNTTPTNTSDTASPSHSKRGIGWPWDYPASLFPLFLNPSTDKLPTWLFNWELWVPGSQPINLEWVACVRTGSQSSDITPYLTDITTNKGRPVSCLLGFNEPEIPSQANMSVEEAVRLWKECVVPAKRTFGLRLGSPGMSSDLAKCTAWLDQFFATLGGVSGAEIDFMVLHWYGPRFEDMKRFLETMYARYGLPVWVNEFACSTMGNGEAKVEDVERFLTQAVPWLDACDWVERYAYFGNAQGQDVGTWVGRASNFTERADGCEETDGRRLTRIGKLYLQL